MNILDYFTALAMFLIGAIVSNVVVVVAPVFGVPGWIAGLGFATLVLVFLYANDRLMGFGMRHFIGLLAKREKTDQSDSDKKQIEKNFTISSDYYGFLAGTALGILVSLF